MVRSGPRVFFIPGLDPNRVLRWHGAMQIATWPLTWACGIVVAAAPVAGAAEPASPPAAHTATARFLAPTVARAAPHPSAARVMRVMPYTAFSRTDQVLMVTATHADPDGRRWLQVQLPKRPNHSTGWVPEEMVVVGRTPVRITVRLRPRVVEVWRAGRRLARFRADVGTARTPTPQGTFAVQDPVTAEPPQSSYLGPYIITLTAYSNVLKTFQGGNGLVAIHGSSGVRGRAVSHGCIRISNRDVRRLRTFAQPGVPVDIVQR